MSASEVELSELKEWLTNEVKLERYFVKLTHYGFCSLSLIQNLDESDLDSVGITPPYHRKRILKYCKDLQMKRPPHVKGEICPQTGNDHNEVSSTTEILRPERSENKEPEVIFDTGNEEAENDPPPLPPKVSKPLCTDQDDVTKAKPNVPDRESSLPRQQLDYNMENITSTTSATVSLLTKHDEARVPDLPGRSSSDVQSSSSSGSEETNVKKIKKPPPIPPRADLDSDHNDQDLLKQENEAVSLQAVQRISVDETNVSNEQKYDLKEHLGTSGDSLSYTPSEMPIAPEKTSAPKPVARPRVTSGKEKPATAPRRQLASQPTSTMDQTTSKNVPADSMSQQVVSEAAPQTQESQGQTEEFDESIYGNMDECQQAVATPHKLPDKANKKPLPAPRKARPTLLNQNEPERQKVPQIPNNQKSNRHSIAISSKLTDRHEEEENAATKQIGKKHTRSLNRLDRIGHVAPEHDIKKQSVTKDRTPVRDVQDKLPSIPPHVEHAEQDLYEVVSDITKDDRGNYT
jgi:hypothetical protein